MIGVTLHGVVLPEFGVHHAGVFEGVNHLHRVRTRFLTFENHCLAGKLTVGDPFQDSGVAGVVRRQEKHR